MAKFTFPLRIDSQLKEAVRDRAKLENRTQTDLIKEAIELYLLTPYNRKTAS